LPFEYNSKGNARSMLVWGQKKFRHKIAAFLGHLPIFGDCLDESFIVDRPGFRQKVQRLANAPGLLELVCLIFVRSFFAGRTDD